ncbi:hypothetical protein KM043_013665 [Ampulex compressa]|nr:hypothetical protein KM043_013665 [Ampulex compressa]
MTCTDTSSVYPEWWEWNRKQNGVAGRKIWCGRGRTEGLPGKFALIVYRLCTAGSSLTKKFSGRKVERARAALGRAIARGWSEGRGSWAKASRFVAKRKDKVVSSEGHRKNRQRNRQGGRQREPPSSARPTIGRISSREILPARSPSATLPPPAAWGESRLTMAFRWPNKRAGTGGPKVETLGESNEAYCRRARRSPRLGKHAATGAQWGKRARCPGPRYREDA